MSQVETASAAINDALPTAHTIRGIPPYYHGPVDFPCYGCCIRSMSAFHGRKVATNSLMMQGSYRYAYPYSYGVGVKLIPETWRRKGFFHDHDYAAGVAGLEIKHLNTAMDRPWSAIWAEWKSFVSNDVPVMVSLRHAEKLWAAAGLPYEGPPVAHTLILAGFDEARGIAIFHDNHWHYRATGTTDLYLMEVPIDVLREAFEPRIKTPTYVVTGLKEPEQPNFVDVLKAHGEMMLGERVSIRFLGPPADDEATSGAPALEAAAQDLMDVATTDQAKTLVRGLTRLLLHNNWQGVEGQPARAAWLSGISAVTHDDQVEEAGYYLDIVADAYCRARDAFGRLKAAVDTEADIASIKLLAGEVANPLMAAATAERSAGRALLRAVDQLTANGWYSSERRPLVGFD